MMANRSDRERGQPTECQRRHSLRNSLGPRSRTPSGPAACLRLHQQAEDKSAPDRRAKRSKRHLQRGSHPDRTFDCHSVRIASNDAGLRQPEMPSPSANTQEPLCTEYTRPSVYRVSAQADCVLLGFRPRRKNTPLVYCFEPTRLVSIIPSVVTSIDRWCATGWESRP